MALQPEKLFSSTLEQLGYGTIDESSGKPIPSCEWLFEKDETKELLVWLCNNLRPSNVLVNEELKKYNELEKQGITLEGEQLEEALETMKAIDNRQDIDTLTQEVSNLQAELNKAQNRLSYMVSDRAKIATQHAKLTYKTADLATFSERLQENSATLHQKLMASVSETKDSIKANDSSVSELVSLHECPAESVEASAFLSHLPFDGYLEKEQALLKQIEGALLDVETRDIKDALTQYNFLGVTDLPPSLLKVEPENTRNVLASELERLRLHFEKTVLLELDAEIQEAKLPAEEQGLKEFDEAVEHLTPDDMLNQLIATQEGISTTSSTIRTHLTQTVPQLSHSLSQISVLPVLETDIKEQSELVQESINAQLQAINQLSHQKSRMEFLKGNLLHEESQHIQTHTLVEATIREVKNAIGKKAVLPPTPPPPSSIIDLGVPSSLSRAHVLLEKYAPTASIVTTDTLVTATKHISQTAATVKASNEAVEKERQGMLSQLWLNINALNKVFFTPQSPLQPSLASPELILANDQLEKLLKVLEGILTDVIKYQKAKQEEMRYWGPERQQERDIYVFFFNHPEQLQQMYNELKQRVDAGKISTTS